MAMQLKPRKNAQTLSGTLLNGRSPALLKQAHEHWVRGVALAKQGRWPQAEAAFAKALAGTPDDVLVMVNLARALQKQGSHGKALAHAQRALELDPANAIARDIAAQCLGQENRHAERAALLLQAPHDMVKDASYYQDLGEALFNAGQHEPAIKALFEALARNVDHALSHYRLGLCFNAMGLKQEATECLRTALILGLGQGDLAAQGLLAFIERELCRWDHAQADLAALQRLALQLPADASAWASVFAQVTLTDDAPLHLRVARACARFQARGARPMASLPPHPLSSHLKVGFVSADFHQHATAVLMAEVFEHLNKADFDVTFYSHGPEDGSPMRRRLMRSCNQFKDVAALSDQAVAEMIRQDGIEVLVDLKGHTRDGRLGIFAHRPAPVQVTYLGFPGTTGADYMDYFIGDALVSPLEHAPHYSEKLALMPVCYQPNDRQRPLPQSMTRAEAGLPADALVLCGFNQPFKLSPEVFDVWCGLLQRLPGAVLWLLQWNEQSPALLRQEAQARGIDPQRLVFAPKVGVAQHISRLALADIFIDAWPCNGHTTASDALWAGVPVVTLRRHSFASRVAGSLLHAVGLPELMADTPQAYEETVLALAQDRARRDALRAHLTQARTTSPLFDSEGFARDFGRLLWRMAQRWSQGLPPDHLPAA